MFRVRVTREDGRDEATACERRDSGTDGLDTEMEARRVAEAGADDRYISPYNDFAVVAGQGTIGAELRRQLTASHGSRCRGRRRLSPVSPPT